MRVPEQDKDAATQPGTERRIILYGHPTLRRRAQPVADVDGEVRAFVDSLFTTMRAAPGIGLAAPQVDRRVRLFVVDPTVADSATRPLALINPEILTYAGINTYEEGCLSIPGIYADVIRPERILVRYVDVEGGVREEEFDGLMARVIQHENDHLDGKLFIDCLTRMRRTLLTRRLREIESRGE